MNEAPGPINFTMFLTLFGERLQGTDPEDVIKNAFGCFDEDNVGLIHEDRLRELLTTIGDRWEFDLYRIDNSTILATPPGQSMTYWRTLLVSPGLTGGVRQC